MLGQPEYLILPKVANVVAGGVVLGLLIFQWLPSAVREWTRSQQRVSDLQTLAALDPLTGIFNRRQFETLAHAELALCASIHATVVRVARRYRLIQKGK